MNVKKLDSTKIYWLDKEETVKAKLVGLDLPNGFGSVKYTFRVIHGGTGDIVYMDSNLPKTIHEVVGQKPWQFTTPIAMKCTEEQFNVIKDRVFEMGYKEVSMSRWNVDSYLVNNVGNTIGYLSNLSSSSAIGNGRMIFEAFNPDLFLALAAMTDKEDGIKGEWWKAKASVEFHVQQGGEVCGLTRAFFRKATAQEIIEHFERKEKKEADRIFKLVLDFQSSLFNKINEDKTIIPIPPSKQATLFDDRVEITDWNPKDNDEVLVVSINVDGWGITKTKYKFVAEPYKAHGFIKRTESEAKQLVEKLKQAML